MRLLRLASFRRFGGARLQRKELGCAGGCVLSFKVVCRVLVTLQLWPCSVSCRTGYLQRSAEAAACAMALPPRAGVACLGSS